MKKINNIKKQDAVLIVNINRLFMYPSIFSLMAFFEQDDKLYCGYVEYLEEIKGIGYPILGEVVSFLEGVITVNYIGSENFDRFHVQQIKYLKPKRQAQFEFNGLLL